MEENKDENLFHKVVGTINEAMENSKSIFFCPNCAHKTVCKKIDKPEEDCKDFMDATTYKQYSSIYHFFQPIFDWINFHYPAGEVKFVVDHNSAKMFIEHGPFVASEELKAFPKNILSNEPNNVQNNEQTGKDQ